MPSPAAAASAAAFAALRCCCHCCCCCLFYSVPVVHLLLLCVPLLLLGGATPAPPLSQHSVAGDAARKIAAEEEARSSSESPATAAAAAAATESLLEYRTNFCYGRTFRHRDVCDWNYLPQIGRLRMLQNAEDEENVEVEEDSDSGDVAERKKARAAASSDDGVVHSGRHNHTRFAIFMQNGRVGSTWLVSLLNSVAKGIDCQGEQFDSNPCKDKEGGQASSRKQKKWSKEGIEAYKAEHLEGFFNECEAKEKNHACGFKILYSTWASRISRSIKDALVKFSEDGGNLKVICLHRDNVFEQMASKMYKETAIEMDLSTKNKKVSNEARTKNITFSLPSKSSGRMDSLLVDQRTYVDFCWSWAPYAEVFSVDYDTLDQSPDDTADRVIQFLGGIHKEKRAATNSSKLAHDHSSIENLDDFLDDARWASMIDTEQWQSRQNGCSVRRRDQIVPLDAFFVGNETECIEPGDLPLDYHDFEFLKCSA